MGERLKRLARQLHLFDPNPEGPVNVQARLKGKTVWFSFGNMTHVKAASQFAQLAEQDAFKNGERIIVETREESLPLMVYSHEVERCPVRFIVTPLRFDDDRQG
jgi:hypothetical protein